VIVNFPFLVFAVSFVALLLRLRSEIPFTRKFAVSQRRADSDFGGVLSGTLRVVSQDLISLSQSLPSA